MSYAIEGAIPAGQHLPEQINVIIEIAAQADPVKYEMNKATGMLEVDRFIATMMRYPCNYGYVPSTHSEDGDPLDVLLVTPFPVQPGALVSARPIGMLSMTDESGRDNKILAVPVDAVSTYYQTVQQPKDLPQSLLDSIAHFFTHYKALEPNKWAKLDCWQGVEVACAEIMASVARATTDSEG